MTLTRRRRSRLILVGAATGMLYLTAFAACNSSEPAAAQPSSASATAAPTRVEITDAGFQPSRVVLGASRKITFRRVTDRTCATAVVFPALGIEKALPLNSDVTVELPASAHGELAFQCGMGMYKSKVVVQ